MISHINETTGDTLGVTTRGQAVGGGEAIANTIGNSTGVVDCIASEEC
jgi:hypothetical protein